MEDILIITWQKESGTIYALRKEFFLIVIKAIGSVTSLRRFGAILWFRNLIFPSKKSDPIQLNTRKFEAP